MDLGYSSEPTAGLIEIPAGEGLTIRLVADRGDLETLQAGGALDQMAKLGALPGLAGPVVGFTNLQAGETFPLGVTLATLSRDAALIPSAVGPDINCGTRLLTSRLREDQVARNLGEVMGEISHLVHVGEHRSGPLAFSTRDIEDSLNEGCRYLVGVKKIGRPKDLEVLETEGHYREATAGVVPYRAKNFASHQLGTLGRGGSHFVELEVVEKVFDFEAASRMGIRDGCVVVQIHAGARELAREVHTACVTDAQNARVPLGLRFQDGLAWVPLSTKHGERSFLAIQAAQNFALCNRHVIAELVRQAFQLSFGADGHLDLACDVGANTVRVERMGGRMMCVHRSGTTTAYGPGHNAVPPAYRDLGQPLLLMGSMGTPSYVMVAQSAAEDLAMASAPHGAGRALSRPEAHRRFSGREVRAELAARGVSVHCPTERRVAEEAPGAYRDAGATAVLMQRAGLARAVAQLRPIAVYKA